MEIEELLVAIGIDTSQAAKIQEVVVALGAAAVAMANEANKINGDLDAIGESAAAGAEAAGKKAEEAGRSMSRLKMIAVGVGAVIGFVSGKVLGFLDSAIAGAQNLSKEKGLLFDISKQELQQADEYQEAMKKTGLSIESIKTKIALNLVPQLTAITQKFNDWLGANKELIAAGLTKIIQWGGKFFQVIINTGRAIGKVIDNTIGWKGAILALGAAFAFLNRKMLLNPITWIIAGIVGLMILIDDLMVYLRGGKSKWGKFWEPCIGWIKSVMTWWNELSREWQTTIKLIGAMLTAAFGSNLFLAVTKGAGGFAKVLGFILSPLRRLISMAMSAGRAFIWLGRALMMNPIGIIIGLVVGLVYVLHDLYKWLTTGESSFSSFWQSCSDAWESIKKAFNDGVDSVGETLKAVTELIKAPFRIAFDWVMEMYDKTLGKVVSLINRLRGVKDEISDIDREANRLNEDEMANLSASMNQQVMAIAKVVQQTSVIPNDPGAVVGGAMSPTTNNRTEVNQGDVHITQTISTNDAAKAASLAIDGFTKQLKQAARNTEGVLAANAR